MKFSQSKTSFFSLIRHQYKPFYNYNNQIVRRLSSISDQVDLGLDKYPNYGVSFSPAGLLTPFHLGASNQLIKLGILNSNCGVAGASGGALAAVSSSLLAFLKEYDLKNEGLELKGGSNPILKDLDELELKKSIESLRKFNPLESCLYIAQKCRDEGTARGTLSTSLTNILQKVLPDSSHKIINNRNAPCIITYATLDFNFSSLIPKYFQNNENEPNQLNTLMISNFTTMSPFKLIPSIKGEYVNLFSSRHDLIECLKASCNIPLYFEKNNFFLKVRNKKAIDGFFSVNYKRFGCPHTFAKKREIIVVPFPISSMPFFNINNFKQVNGSLSKGINDKCDYEIISPDLLKKEDWPFNLYELTKLTLDIPISPNKKRKDVTDEEILEVYQKLFKAGEESVKIWYETTGKYNWKEHIDENLNKKRE